MVSDQVVPRLRYGRRAQVDHQVGSFDRALRVPGKCPQMKAIRSTLTRHLQAYWVKYIDQANISMYNPDPSGNLSTDLP
jgi:hypothetical protein